MYLCPAPWYKNLISELRLGRKLTVTGIWCSNNNGWANFVGLYDCVDVSVEDAEISEELRKHLERMAEIIKAKEAYDAEYPFEEVGFLSEEEKEKIQSLVLTHYELMNKHP